MGGVHIVCSTREGISLWEPNENRAHYHIVDAALPKSNNIVKRSLKSLSFQRRVYPYLCKVRPRLLYCTGFDSLSVAYKYCRDHTASIIYEISDLREDFTTDSTNRMRSLVSRLVRFMDAKYVRSVSLLVVTSPQFYLKYYYRHIDISKVVFIPNSPEKRFFRDYCHKNSGTFTVGFIGGIRYYDQLRLMVDAVNLAGCDGFFAGGHFSGDDSDRLKKYCAPYDNVSFQGRYDYEKDIAELYGKVDCVYAVYDADNENVRMALPNKLYEAIVCELPIIVAKGTYLAYVTEKLGVGVAVNHKDEYGLAHVIERLMEDKSYYDSFVRKCQWIKNNADALLEGLRDRPI